MLTAPEIIYAATEVAREARRVVPRRELLQDAVLRLHNVLFPILGKPEAHGYADPISPLVYQLERYLEATYYRMPSWEEEAERAIKRAYPFADSRLGTPRPVYALPREYPYEVTHDFLANPEDKPAGVRFIEMTTGMRRY